MSNINAAFVTWDIIMSNINAVFVTWDIIMSYTNAVFVTWDIMSNINVGIREYISMHNFKLLCYL